MTGKRPRTTVELAKDVVLRAVDGNVSLDSYFFTADHHLAQASGAAAIQEDPSAIS